MTKEEDLKEAIRLMQHILSEKRSLLLGDLNAAINLLEKHKLKDAVSICYKVSAAEAQVAECANELIQPLFFELKKVIIDELKKNK